MSKSSRRVWCSSPACLRVLRAVGKSANESSGKSETLAPSRGHDTGTSARSGSGGVTSKLLAYIELVRPHNIVAAVLCVILGILAASRVTGHPLDPLDAAIASTAVAFVSAGGYAVNDYFDYQVDSINKPYRPIPSGRVSRRGVLYFSIILGAVGVVLSTWFGYLSFIFVLLNSFVVYAYSAKIKEWGIVGNVVVSLEGGASIFYGSLAVYTRVGKYSALASSIIPIAIAFVLLLGREIVKTIEDYYADSVRGVRSLPRVIGLRASAIAASAILLSLPVLSTLPLLSTYYNTTVYSPLATITVVIVVISAIKVLRSSNVVSAAIKVRSSLKIAIITGILALLLSLFL